MLRPVLILSAFSLLAGPATAASYSAKLASAAGGHIIARDLNWSCGESGCEGATDESRPAVLCEALAKRAGRVESFAVDGRAFSEAELAKCNASIRTAPGKALAAQ